MSQLCHDLLTQAEELLRKDKNKPKQANVRRAVSTSYYALFHFLSDNVTRKLVGTTNEVFKVRLWLARALEHKTMSNVCKFFGDAKAKKFKDLETKLNFAADHDLEIIAQIFVELQELRHSADYDLSESITKAEAQTAITQTHQAFKLWDNLEQKHPKLLLIFCHSLLSWNTLSKR